MSRRPTVFFDRLRDSLDISWLAEDLVLILLPGGYRLAVGWFGQLEGDGHFELRLTGRSASNCTEAGTAGTRAGSAK